ERGTSMTTDGISSDCRTPSSQPGDRAEPPAIVFTGVSKAFGSKTVLEGFNLQVNRGEVFALLGANGAGKTTCISILTTLRRADAGSVQDRKGGVEGRA